MPPKHVAELLLNNAHAPDVAASIFTEKILHKPVYLRPTSPDPTSQDARAQRRLVRLRKAEKIRRRKKVKPLSAKEKRLSGIYDIPDELKTYEVYEPLHKLWQAYMREILDIKKDDRVYITAQNKGNILASADYHGALLTVVRSSCSSVVSLRGIVVRDTKFTFQIITTRNELKIIPKKDTIFQFQVSDEADETSTPDANSGGLGTNGVTSSLLEKPLTFEIHGSHFETRPADRATKKFKQKVSG